jgi:hypothetical protein
VLVLLLRKPVGCHTQRQRYDFVRSISTLAIPLLSSLSPPTREVVCSTILARDRFCERHCRLNHEQRKGDKSCDHSVPSRLGYFWWIRFHCGESSIVCPVRALTARRLSMFEEASKRGSGPIRREEDGEPYRRLGPPKRGERNLRSLNR